MSQDSDARKPPPGWERFLNVFVSPGTSKQSTSPGSSQRLPDENGNSHRLHSTTEATPKRRHMDPKYNIQPSNWNSPAVNQRIIQSKQSESGTHKPSISAIVPRAQAPAANIEPKPLATTAGRRRVRAKRPSIFLSPNIKSTSVLNEERKLWKDLSEKTSFAKPRSEDVKHVGFRNGGTMPTVNRLYNKSVMTKRPFLLEKPDESNDVSRSSAPKSKRTRVSFDADTFDSRGTNDDAPARAATADYFRRNIAEPQSESLIEDADLPMKSISTDPIILHDYKGYRDSRTAIIHGNPADDYKDIKKAVPAAKTAGANSEEESPPWECKMCKNMNPNDESICSKCNDPRSRKADVIGWGTIFANQKPTWKCTVCSVGNDLEAVRCASCETERPGELSSGSNGASTSSKGTSLVSEATERARDSVSKPFAFGSEGAKVSETKNEPAKFTFGAPTTTSSPSSEPQLLSFGNVSSAASPKPPSFSFGSSPISSDAPQKLQSFSFGNAPAPSDPSPKPPSFSFGKVTAPAGPSSQSQDLEASPTRPAVAFGGTPATTDTSAKPFSFIGTPATSDTSAKPFSFGGGTPATTNTPAKPFSFGGGIPAQSDSASDQPPATAVGGPIFPTVSDDKKDLLLNNEKGQSAVASPAAPFSFGSSHTRNSQPADATNLGQNSTSTAASSFVQQGDSQLFKFGATAETPEDGDSEKRKKSKPSFAFGGGGKLPPISENTSSFDAVRQPNVSQDKETVFSGSGPFSVGNSSDQTRKGDSSTSSGFVFGSKQETLPSNSNASDESASFSQPFGTTSTFSGAFDATSAPTDTVTNTNVPTFGSNVSVSNGFGTSSSLPSFGNATQGPATFGAPAPPAFGTSAPTFGAPTLSAGFGATPVPSFGGQPVSAPASNAPMFGAVASQPSSAPAFGAPTFGAPNPFGSITAAPTGFGMSGGPAAVSAPTFGGFTSAPAPNFSQTGQVPGFGAPEASHSFGQPSQQPSSFGAPQGFGGQAPSFGAGAADGGFNLGSGGGPSKRRIVRVRRK